MKLLFCILFALSVNAYALIVYLKQMKKYKDSFQERAEEAAKKFLKWQFALSDLRLTEQSIHHGKLEEFILEEFNKD